MTEHLPAAEGWSPAGTAGDSSTRLLLLALLVAAAVVVTILPVFLVGALAVPLQAELGLSNAALGSVVGLFYLASGTVAVRAGRAVDRLGWRVSAAAAALSATVTMAAIALGVRGPVGLAIAIAVAGGCHTVAMSASNLFIVRRVRGRRQALTFGAKQSASPLALLIAGAAVPVLALTLGWRSAFWVGAGIALAVSALMLANREGRRPPRGRPARAAVARAATPTVPMWAWVVSGTLASATVGALSAFLVITSIEAGMQQQAGAQLLMLGSVVGISIRLAAGWVADARGTDGALLIAGLVGVGALGFLLLADARPLAVVAGTVLGFAGGWGWPGLFHFAVVRQNAHRPAAATGTIHAGLCLGAAVGPAAFGFCTDMLSLRTAWLWTCGCALMAAVVLVLAWRRANTNSRPGAAALVSQSPSTP